MARSGNFGYGIGIALGAAALASSPGARHAAKKGLRAARDGAIKVARVVVRGTRNLQEESKHVTRFGDNVPDAGSNS